MEQMTSQDNQDARPKQVITDVVSRTILKEMEVGEQTEFIVPTVSQMRSARSACQQLKLEGMKFTTKFRIIYSVTVERTE